MIMDKEIEIPFGAKDSELKNWEYTIPDDMEAIIENGKIIVRKKESEEERIRKELITHCRNTRCVTEEGGERIAKWISWLEKQVSPQMVADAYLRGCNDTEEKWIEKQGEQNSTWSEEDEKIKQDIVNLIHFALRDGSAVSPAADTTKEDAISWIQSLKERYTWKPSDEQMEALLYETEAWDKDSINCQNLTLLYNDLKKLKGE